MSRDHMRAGLCIAALLLFVVAGRAQWYRFQRREEGPRPAFPSSAEFHFVRMEYTDLPQYHRGFGFASRDGRGEGWWLVDWPDADDHFTVGVQGLCRVDTGDSRRLRLITDQVFDYT